MRPWRAIAATPASWAARQSHLQSVMKQLDAIPAAELSPEEAVNAAVFRAWLEEDLTDLRFKAYEAPVNSDSFFWSYLAPQDGFQNADEYRRYIARLRDIPRYFDENVANMRAGLKRGFSVPRAVLRSPEAKAVMLRMDMRFPEGRWMGEW